MYVPGMVMEGKESQCGPKGETEGEDGGHFVKGVTCVRESLLTLRGTDMHKRPGL